jgi:glutamate dehydrogenase (NADP+)
MISRSYAVASRAIAAWSSSLPTAAAAAAAAVPARRLDGDDSATATMTSSLSSSRAMSSQPKAKKHLVTHEDGVHQNMQLSKSWRSKPLFRRQGDVRFKSGLEASTLLIAEANRRDSHETEFIESVTATMDVLSPLFERNPRYAFVAKQLMEPDRFVQFRVTWMDDAGVTRMNRGFRIQYTSSLGPYEGPLHLGPHINAAMIKALGFDNVFSNALTGYDVGSSVGGSDFQPSNKSENEVQRFCQSYMTELARYVGPDVDHPTMGMGCAEKEMGYLFGQYKRINTKCTSANVPFMDQTFSHVCFFDGRGRGGGCILSSAIFFYRR